MRVRFIEEKRGVLVWSGLVWSGRTVDLHSLISFIWFIREVR